MMIFRCSTLITLSALVASAALTSALAAPVDYRLGPDDKLQIKVFDWRTGSGEAYQWQALTGEFVVGANGQLSLPLLGDVAVEGSTPSAVAALIGERLQSKIGLAQRPDASVQIIKYRPFYVLGVVERQGEYEYRPDLTVLQALSVAGGLIRRDQGNAAGLERETLTGRGDVRTLAAERDELTIRQARLDAEIGDQATVSYPPRIAKLEADPDIGRAMHQEDALLKTRRDAIDAQTETLKQTQSLLEHQIITLAAKDVSLSHQLSVTRQELDQISGLVSQGLAVLPRKLAIEENASQYESSRLDVQLATLRAQQDIAKAARDMTDLRSKARNDALTEASQVRTRLAEVEQRLETAQTLVLDAESRDPTAATHTLAPLSPNFTITRMSDGHALSLAAEEGDAVLPGDVVRVVFAAPDVGEAQKVGTLSQGNKETSDHIASDN